MSFVELVLCTFHFVLLQADLYTTEWLTDELRNSISCQYYLFFVCFDSCLKCFFGAFFNMLGNA